MVLRKRIELTTSNLRAAARVLRPGFQSNSLEVVAGVLQHRQQRFRFARNLHFPNDLAGVIHNADAGLLDRYLQSRKMVHAALQADGSTRSAFTASSRHLSTRHQQARVTSCVFFRRSTRHSKVKTVGSRFAPTQLCSARCTLVKLSVRLLVSPGREPKLSWHCNCSVAPDRRRF